MLVIPALRTLFTPLLLFFDTLFGYSYSSCTYSFHASFGILLYCLACTSLHLSPIVFAVCTFSHLPYCHGTCLYKLLAIVHSLYLFYIPLCTFIYVRTMLCYPFPSAPSECRTSYPWALMPREPLVHRRLYPQALKPRASTSAPDASFPGS